MTRFVSSLDAGDFLTGRTSPGLSPALREHDRRRFHALVAHGLAVPLAA
jgi:hypothetical protein